VNPYLVLAIIATVGATSYFSSLNLALVQASRAGLEEEFEARIEYRYDDGVTMILAQGDDAIRQGTKFIGERGWIYVTRGKTEASDPALLKAALPSGATRLISSSNHHNHSSERSSK
jgi:hypothetical protein